MPTATSRPAVPGRLPAADRDRADSLRLAVQRLRGGCRCDFGYAAGVLLMVPLFVMMILPFLNGSFDSANLTNKLGDSGLAWGGLQLALVWLWLMCWSAWGWMSVPPLPPNTRTRSGTRNWRCARRRCSRWSSTSSSLSGSSAEPGPTLVRGYDYPGAMDKIVGSTRFTDFFVVCLIASFIITMNTATADGGRALYGISRDGMTIKQLGTLNRFQSRATR